MLVVTHLWLNRSDVVGGKHPGLVPDASPPPLSFSLRHHDNIPLDKRQVARLWALVRVQSHILWLGLNRRIETAGSLTMTNDEIIIIISRLIKFTL